MSAPSAGGRPREDDVQLPDQLLDLNHEKPPPDEPPGLGRQGRKRAGTRVTGHRGCAHHAGHFPVFCAVAFAVNLVRAEAPLCAGAER